jgi:hypothetical protein
MCPVSETKNPLGLRAHCSRFAGLSVCHPGASRISAHYYFQGDDERSAAGGPPRPLLRLAIYNKQQELSAAKRQLNFQPSLNSSNWPDLNCWPAAAFQEQLDELGHRTPVCRCGCHELISDFSGAGPLVGRRRIVRSARRRGRRRLQLDTKQKRSMSASANQAWCSR